MKARVFLIDYGIYLDSLSVLSCLRTLPRGMTNYSPRAFQLVLAGGKIQVLTW